MGDATDRGFRRDGFIYAEHPDPSWARRRWTSLDGTWKIAHRGVERDIRVPFPVGSPDAGVDFRDSGSFVYRRRFDLPGFSADRRYILRIGACDYEAAVSLNGKALGRHFGGYASFSFDVTGAAGARDNLLEIRVRDSHSPFQVRGKQTFLRREFAVWYPGISGLWQSVWIEEAGRRYLSRAETRVDFAARQVELRVWTGPEAESGGERPADAAGDWGLSLEIGSEGGPRATFAAVPAAPGGASDPAASFVARIGFDEFRAETWSAESPRLHSLKFRLTRDGETQDEVESYLGIRDVAVRGPEFLVNGKPVFLRMALVQGYYPGGVYAPRSCARLAADIEALKALGYNGARVHQKVESPYFQFLCDRLGLYATFEMPSFYLPSRRAFARYESELRELVARDSGHPSCVMRILFNETWGIWGVYRRRSATRSFVLRMVELAKRLDPSRPVIDNSGWEHLRTDIVDFHHYLGSAELARKAYRAIAGGDEDALRGLSLRRVLRFYLGDSIAAMTRPLFVRDAEASPGAPLFLSEYGGFGWYKTDRPDAVAESLEEYTRDAVESGLFCGYCYTQLYDVGGETNGLLTFEREPKVEAARVRAANGA